MDWYNLVVRHIERLTADSVRIDFSPENDIRKEFDFEAGQYLTLETEINGETIRRSYSLCSSPTTDILSVGIKEITNGKFSTYANRVLKKGDVIKSSKPEGTFTNKQESEEHKHFVFIAAGSGITPILSMIKSTLGKSQTNQVSLFYGNKTMNSVMFKNETSKLTESYPVRLKTHYILSQEDQYDINLKGRINREKIQNWDGNLFDSSKVDSFFMCGPEDMILDIKEELLQKKVANSQIHFELFNTSSGEKLRESRKEDEQNLSTSKIVNIVLDGKTTPYEFTSATDNILDLALENDEDLPFACKGGVCCTCKAKLQEGEVKMYVNYGLEPEEVEQGFILTCQSYPITDTVVVDFDDI